MNLTLSFAVGAGSAGAVVANRLSEDPRHRVSSKEFNIRSFTLKFQFAHQIFFLPFEQVLLLEAGGYETFQSEIPMLAARLQKSRWDWGYKTVPQTHGDFSISFETLRLFVTNGSLSSPE